MLAMFAVAGVQICEISKDPKCLPTLPPRIFRCVRDPPTSQRPIAESVRARLDLGPVLPPLPAPAVRIPPAQISPADEPNGTVAAGAANAAIGGRGRRRRSSTVAASINAVLDQKGPPPAEVRAPSDAGESQRRLRATARQRQVAEPHSGAADRLSAAGTAICAGCTRTSSPSGAQLRSSWGVGAVPEGDALRRA